MASDDFAAAQKRILARQHARATESQARVEERKQRAIALRARFPVPGIERGLQAWDRLNNSEGTRPAFRAGQLDAELLDEELLELLKGQVGEGLRFFGSHLIQDWSAEVSLALRAILYKLSIWDHNSSYGAALQGLEYRNANGSAPSMVQKVLYGLITVGGRYGWGRWQDWLIDKDNTWARVTSIASTSHDLAAFLSFLVFLVNGRYRTLLDRILGLRLVAPSSQIRREVSFEYLNRQLVWHAFTEFLLFLLPLMGINRWRRWLSKAWRKAKFLTQGEEEGGELSFLPERTCAICYQDQNQTTAEQTLSGGGGVVGSAQTDITNPYEATCGCVYCFVCLATRLADGEGFICLRCGELVKKCKPWSGDVVEAKKSVSFDDVVVSTP